MKKRKEKASDRELKSTARGNRGKRARRRDDTPARDEQWWREGGREEEGDTRGGDEPREDEEEERGQAKGRWDEMLVVLTV